MYLAAGGWHQAYTLLYCAHIDYYTVKKSVPSSGLRRQRRSESESLALQAAAGHSHPSPSGLGLVLPTRFESQCDLNVSHPTPSRVGFSLLLQHWQSPLPTCAKRHPSQWHGSESPGTDPSLPLAAGAAHPSPAAAASAIRVPAQLWQRSRI